MKKDVEDQHLPQGKRYFNENARHHQRVSFSTYATSLANKFRMGIWRIAYCCAHLIGQFQHESNRSTINVDSVYVHDLINPLPMRSIEREQMASKRNWILEIHFVDRETCRLAASDAKNC